MKKIFVVLAAMLLLVIMACSGGGGNSNSNTSQVTGTIKSSGGTIEVTDPSNPLYKLKLTIPENAMTQTANIKISVSDKLLTLPEGLTGNGIVIAIESNVRTFSIPVSMTIPYKKTDVPIVISYDDATDRYSILPVVGIDSANGNITVLTSHFSLFQMVKSNLGSWVNVKSNFNIPEDAFDIVNTAENMAGTNAAGGACFGFATYSKWYFENKKKSDGILQSRYGYNEKYVVSDAWDLQKKNWDYALTQMIDLLGYLANPRANATAFYSLWSSMILNKMSDGGSKPQVLTLCEGVIGQNCTHAVLATGISFKQNNLGIPYADIQIYNNADRTKKGNIQYYYLTDSLITFEMGAHSYNHILYTGDATFYSEDGMLAIYNKYKSSPVPDTTPPTLVSSNPANGAINVPASNRTVSHTFSEPMAHYRSVVWTGLTGGNADNPIPPSVWSADLRTISTTFGYDFDKGATIGWVLNDPGWEGGFQDLAGNKLATVSGSFRVAP